jgi:hypothetical protein
MIVPFRHKPGKSTSAAKAVCHFRQYRSGKPLRHPKATRKLTRIRMIVPFRHKPGKSTSAAKAVCVSDSIAAVNRCATQKRRASSNVLTESCPTRI